MRTETEMFSQIRRVVDDDDRIRAAWLNGSRADPEAARDCLQDYDLVLAVTALESLCSLAHWADAFGPLAVAQEPDASVLFQDGREPGRYAYLMQFADGVRIDLTLLTTEKARESFGRDRMTVLLADKDGLFPSCPPPDDGEYHIKRPGPKEFAGCCNEFWWVFPYAAKGLWRGELLYAAEALNSYVRPMLLMMLGWKAGIRTSFSCTAGKSGKLLPKLLPAADTAALYATYCAAETDALWTALEEAARLFSSTARLVADAFGFVYRGEEERGSRAIAAMFREDRLFSSPAEREAFRRAAAESALFSPDAPVAVTAAEAQRRMGLHGETHGESVHSEIERKFLIEGFPALEEKGRSVLRQGYLCTGPVVRIRSRTDIAGKRVCRLCFKGRGLLERKEIELEISGELFDALCELLPMPPLEKEQRTYALEGGLTLECNDVEHGGYRYAEVEFPSVEAALAFAPPAFLGEELTGKQGFSMSDYWNRTLAERDAQGRIDPDTAGRP